MMKAKLVLLSKTNNEFPGIGEMRPTSLLPMLPNF